MNNSVFIFRRDLRLEDNSGLISALSAGTVLPCFIFDPRQLEKNEYRSENCIQFMVESLVDLDEQLKKFNSRLYLFYGLPEKVIGDLIEMGFTSVFVNRDYTPFSKERDQKIREIIYKKGAELHSHSDYLLHEPEEVATGNGKPYTVFTPFFRKAIQIKVRDPMKIKNCPIRFYNGEFDFEDKQILEKIKKNKNIFAKVSGGRNEGLKILSKLSQQKNYTVDRNYPAKESTTHLSAHNKFGTVSIREVYYKIKEELGEKHTLITELFWRDFFTHIAFHFPEVLGSAFNKKYNKIIWTNNEAHFKAWCRGKTGFPIVDAGMRELNKSGFMHNRVRMIVASFLTKDLHIDWKIGEKYFAQKLIDYDPAVNNGNWQWAASTGSDAQPYFRIFNPFLQQEKFDPDCIYIKKWLPELQKLTARQIHSLEKDFPRGLEYPKPIIDHKIESNIAKQKYKDIVK